MQLPEQFGAEVGISSQCVAAVIPSLKAAHARLSTSPTLGSAFL